MCDVVMWCGGGGKEGSNSNFFKIDVNLKTANSNFYSVKIVVDKGSNSNFSKIDLNLKMVNSNFFSVELPVEHFCCRRFDL